MFGGEERGGCLGGGEAFCLEAASSRPVDVSPENRRCRALHQSM